MASAKNRGNEVLAKLLMKQELVKKLAASQKDKPSSEVPEKRSSGVVLQKSSSAARPGAGVMQHHKDQTNKVAPKKKDTLYCICKRPYDHTRFYIGCDVCSNWFHGKCVAISPSMARNMSGYTCAECKVKTTSTTTSSTSATTSAATLPSKQEPAAEPEGDLFCICRTPYNQYSFYIGCDSCQEWYHGTCVGISEMEAEKIEVYICDRCKQQQGREEPKLTHIQIAGLIKILRELQMHKMSWPFREPGKSDSETDVIKEPMDLSTIHKKFQKKHYPKLTLFVKDVLRVFSNARQLYSEDSQRGRCADTLERYFVAKLNEFKLRHGLTLS
ncbi:nucleosome-remodeling factor subunit NURF301-like [Bolinopsis microptera]|uniref:nucleosome-remodeling factor subunit NURF301-like n=1 Tax=Bolinopsis microptera TaxID=2820187 RepID=UPI0030791F3D